ncbi:hypothetical protein [Mycolicibacillus koreensis]|uniref:hypothetical protein n=1 Tax=Mycolicibacillus koreensis TaxID=1069220 RepID=UPI00138CDFFE|nr:hypothetical protein [Mycolicibacillus koreensis]BBY55667.1 hypothetical protein MKOR_29180 [Mycolicibacillus koreensis]
MGPSRSWRARGALGVLAVMVAAALVPAGAAAADSDQPPPPLPVFTPGPTAWKPNFDIWPYSTFTYQVTPQMIAGMSDSCQWFNAQFDPLMGQINDFHGNLNSKASDYSAGGVAAQADAVTANIDQSTAFLGPRLQPLTIRNNPDNFGPYSPIYGGEYITKAMFQLTQISDKIKKREPAGVVHANIVHATGWGDALKGSGACNNA